MREFLSESLWVLWVGTALALALLELTSLDFVFSMLVAGALAAAVAAALGLNFTVQAFTFAGVSLIGLLLVRPYLKRLAERSSPEQPTNVDALVGRGAITLTVVDERSGQVKLGGETWTARTEPRTGPIVADADVRVVRVEGATVVVRLDPAAPPTNQPPANQPPMHPPA